MIGSCARSGYAPFNDYPVDFFLALPDEAACRSVRARLEPEFSVDVQADEGEAPAISLHATKTMRLIVPDMQAISRRLTALATESRRALRRLGRASASALLGLPPDGFGRCRDGRRVAQVAAADGLSCPSSS